jgi:hypothetical protein
MPRSVSTLSLWLATAASCECCPLLLTHPRTYSTHPLFPSDLNGETTSVPSGKVAVMLACVPRADRVPVSQVRPPRRRGTTGHELNDVMSRNATVAGAPHENSTMITVCCMLQHIRCTLMLLSLLLGG